MNKHPECIWYPNELGDYYKKGDKGYIPILKNQSSSIGSLVRGGCKIVNIKNETCKEFICVYREPFKRYVSGVSQWLKGGGTFGKGVKIMSGGEFVLGKHTYPQSWFLTPFIGENIELIKTNGSSSKKVCNFLDIKYKKIRGNITPKNIKNDSDLLCEYWEDDIRRFLLQDYSFFKLFFKKTF